MYGAVLLYLLCVVNSLHASNISISVNPWAGLNLPYCQPETTTGNFIMCNDLDLAIVYAVSLNQLNPVTSDVNSTVTISLPNGVHHITTPTNFGDASVNFIGLGGDVMVVCEYFANNETFEATEIHTWYFNKSNSVGMENIHFRNCGFPFRFIFVQRVNIVNCTYM